MSNFSYSKRRPWPYDLYIGSDLKCLLEPGVDGNMVAQKSKTLDATAPVDYNYGSANPFKERTFEWQQLFGGLGVAVAPDTVPRRYSHAIRVDTSIDGIWMKGPKFETHIETINAGAGEVKQLILALHGGNVVVFAICHNGVWRRTADGTWVASLTSGTSPALPAGTHPQSALRFKSKGSPSVDALYLGTDNSNLWQYDGAAWVLCAAAAGPGTGAVQGEARFLERVSDEFWVAGDYWIVKAEENPLDRTKYGGVIYIGDQSCKITWLRQVDNTLYIFKQDGIYTVSDTGVDQELFPTLRTKLSSLNGKNASVWLDKLWVPFGDQTFFLNPEGKITADGLEQMLENTSEVRGHMVAGAGHNTWFFYELYYSSVNNTTYLIKHGTWVEDTGGIGNTEFVNAHHGALATWNKQASCCNVISNIHSTGNDRLYVGFADGTVEWCVLPKDGPNPSQDSNCEFTAQDSYIYLPIHHSNFRADNKSYRGITAFGPTLTPTEWMEFQYRLDYTNPLTAWVTLTDETGNAKFTLPGQRVNFATESNVFGRSIQMRVKLCKDSNLAASPANLTPVISGIAVHETVRPSLSLEYTFSVKVGSFLAKHNGQVDRRRGTKLREQVLTQCAEVGPVAVRLPTGEVEEMILTEYQESSASFEKRRDFDYVIHISGLQLRTISHSRAFSSLTYATLEQYTVGQLESII